MISRSNLEFFHLCFVDTVRKSKSIVASNCGRAGNASNSVEQVSPRGLFFERTMKRWSRQTIVSITLQTSSVLLLRNFDYNSTVMVE